jgi:AraC family transcriptional regulator of adaptative response / DNA-3-methyladenine glycosylase II
MLCWPFLQPVPFRRSSRSPVRISITDGEGELACRIVADDPLPLIDIAEKVKRLFDLNAFPDEISDGLCRDADLAPLVERSPGLRLRGAWDPFETAVRAIVGQQISVAAATTVMGKIAQRFGTESPYGLLFPDPLQLSVLTADQLPMPTRRATALRDLARAVHSGEVDFDSEPDDVRRSLLDIKGIGPWTAQYISMRALNDPDAFPETDLVVLKAAQTHLQVSGPVELLRRAENWRPWRSYACMHLWAASVPT